jgi:hypothetical protein
MKTFGDARFVRSAHAAAMSMVGEQMLTEIIDECLEFRRGDLGLPALHFG